MLTRSFLRSYLVFTQKDYKINFQIENGLQQIETEHKMTIDIPSISQISDIEVEFKKAKQALSAKELVDNAPSNIKENISPAEAEGHKATLVEAGADIEIK